MGKSFFYHVESPTSILEEPTIEQGRESRQQGRGRDSVTAGAGRGYGQMAYLREDGRRAAAGQWGDGCGRVDRSTTEDEERVEGLQKQCREATEVCISKAYA